MIKKLGNIIYIPVLLIIVIFISACTASSGRVEGSGTVEPGTTSAASQPAVTSTPQPTSTPEPSPAPTTTPEIKNVPAPVEKPKVKKTIPILYYHAVNDQMEGIEELYVSPKEFEKQMEYLKNNGYSVITFDELENAQEVEKPVVITFDDGYEDNYIYAYPVLKKNNFKATIFLCADFIDNPSILKRAQIKDMQDIINFQSHTLTHPYLTQLKIEDAERELAESKRKIEELTGEKADVFAYPIGDYNEQILKLTQKYYRYAVANGGGLYTQGDSPYEIKRVYIPRHLDIKGFETKIKVNSK